MRAAAGLLAPKPLDDLALARPLARPADGRQHRVGDDFRRDAQLVEFRIGLDGAHALQHAGRVDQFGLRQFLAQMEIGVGRQETGLDADARPLLAGLAQMRHRKGGGIQRAPGRGVDVRRPERMVLVLAVFHLVADIGGALHSTLLVNHDRQVAAVADGVHGGEEDELVATEQVLRVMLGGRDKNVDAGLVHQPVDTGLVERHSRSAGLARYTIHLDLPETRRPQRNAARESAFVTRIRHSANLVLPDQAGFFLAS